MNFHTHPITVSVWLLMEALQLLLGGILLLKPVWPARRYPSFSLYIWFYSIESGVVMGCALFVSYAAYWWAFWIGEVFLCVLLGLVIRELWCEIFRPAAAFPREILHRFFAGLAAFGILAAGGALYRPCPFEDFLVIITRPAFHCMAVFTAGAAILVVCFGNYFGAHWRTRVFGIALGLVFQLSVAAVLQMLYAKRVTVAPDLLSALFPASSVVALLVWIAYFLMPEQRAMVITDVEARAIVNEFGRPAR